MLVKSCTQYPSKFGKCSSGHRTGKCQFSIQSQRKAMPKNAQTTAQLHSHASKVILKILQARLQQYMNHELPDVQAGLEKAEEPEIKLPTSRGSLTEKEMAPHSSTLAWKIPWMEETGGLQSMGLLRVRHDWATSLSLFTFMHWRRKWQPTPVFFPGES